VLDLDLLIFIFSMFQLFVTIRVSMEDVHLSIIVNVIKVTKEAHVNKVGIPISLCFTTHLCSF